ncbi:MAG: PadR family transcriptional regulator [Candidatus Methanofastidiosia archaeon]
MEHKLTKEVVWIYVLKLLRERPMYGYEFKARIKDVFGWSPATITSYMVLYKLESGGYIKTELKNSNEGKTNRKYYIITEKGEQLLSDGRKFIKEILEKIEK